MILKGWILFDLMTQRYVHMIDLTFYIPCYRWNIVRGDSVKVIQGPQAGQQGKVLQVLRKKERVLIDGVNMRRRIIKPTPDGTPGRFVVRPCTVHYSNVMLMDPTLNEPTKISYKFLEDGTKVRVSKKSGAIIPKPDLSSDRIPRPLSKCEPC